MALKSMLLTQSQQNKEAAEIKEPKPPVYAGGLCLYLDDKALELLGTKKLDIGAKVTISALAEVVSLSAYKREGDDGEPKAETSMSLQITDMEIAGEKKAAVDTDKLYSSMKD